MSMDGYAAPQFIVDAFDALTPEQVAALPDDDEDCCSCGCTCCG